MALFNRRQEEQKTLPEIEKYYEAERRERAGLAWLLALVSVACITLVLIGLFLGGRWAVNRFIRDDEPVAVKTSDESSAVKPDGTINDGGSANKTQTPAPAAAPKPTPAPAPAAQNPTPTPATRPAPSTSNLPSTGVGSMGLVFMASAFIAWFGHQLLLRHKA